MAHATAMTTVATKAALPFEARVERVHDNQFALEVWQFPLHGMGLSGGEPVRVARLGGLALNLTWDDLMLFLHHSGMKASLLAPARRERALPLPEHVGVRLALLAAVLSPLRKPERLETTARALTRMSYDEACYWYAHVRSEHGHRALRALRCLLSPE